MKNNLIIVGLYFALNSVGLGASVSLGEIVMFSDRSSFLNANAIAGGQDFNGENTELSFSRDPVFFPHFSVSLTGTLTGSMGLPTHNIIDILPHTFSEFGVDGTTFLYVLLRADATSDFQIRFDEPIVAFGADFSGINDGGNRIDTILIDNVPFSLPTEPEFFGMRSTTPFTEVRFLRPPNNDGFGVDNIIWSVPEPSSGGLIVAAVYGVFFRRNRQGSNPLTPDLRASLRRSGRGRPENQLPIIHSSNLPRSHPTITRRAE